jgi:membrane-associated phospholipid phosphatase
VISVCSFLNAGKLRISVLGWSVDREVLYGALFLLLIAALLLVFRLLNPVGHPIVQFCRLFYPQLLYLLFFHEAILLSQLFYGGKSLDAVFAGADHLLFGFQPAIEFHRALPAHPLLTEVFFFGYFFYFALMTTGWWLLYLQGRYREAARAFSITTAAFFVMFIFYIFFPVQGPKYYFAELRSIWYRNFDGYLFTAFMRGTFDRLNLAGAAFPSSHVVIAIIALLLNRRCNPRLAAVFLPLTLLLFLSTIYLYAHYAVDVLAGMIVGPLLYIFVPRLLDRSRSLLLVLEDALSRPFRLPPIALQPRALPEEEADRCA